MSIDATNPPPIDSDGPDCWEAIIARAKVEGKPDWLIEAMVARRELGIRRYGTALRPHNGRDAVLDLFEEFLDARAYAQQIVIEGEHRDSSWLHALSAQIDRWLVTVGLAMRRPR